jgi:hypothetical protein
MKARDCAQHGDLGRSTAERGVVGGQAMPINAAKRDLLYRKVCPPVRSCNETTSD